MIMVRRRREISFPSYSEAFYAVLLLYLTVSSNFLLHVVFEMSGRMTCSYSCRRSSADGGSIIPDNEM